MSGKKTVLILGGGTMQIPAIEAAKEKGWRAAVADADSGAPGISLADLFIHVDLKDRKGLIEAARQLKREGLDGVFTAGTDFSTSVAAIADALGLPGIPVSAAETAKHKIRMRECFSRAGIPSPKFMLISREEQCETAVRTLTLPLVIKPADNMGARGVKLIETLRDCIDSFKAARQFSSSGEVIAEEYISGPEFSLDALIYGGNIDICGFADRHIRFSPYFVEMGHTMPTMLEKKERQRVIGCFVRGIEALGITEGAAKGDIKLSADGPVVGEIAARLSGGYMSGWTYPYASGHDLTSSALDIAAGYPPSGRHGGYPLASAERAFISIPGRVAEISGIRSAKQRPYVKDVFLRTSYGEEPVFPRNNVEKCGNVISQAPNREDAVQAAEAAAGLIFIRLEAGNTDTARFLFTPDVNWPPPAFTLGVEENIHALDSMPDFIDESAGKGPVLIIPAIDSENGKEWHGTGLRETFRRCTERKRRISGIPGKVFWTAMLRGGRQGGEWVLDSLEVAERKGKKIREEIRSWKRIGL